VPLDQLQHSANWAATFGGSDTNIAERARHNQQIQEYGDAMVQARANAQMQMLQTNQVAQNLFIKTQQLQQKEQLDNARLQIDAARVVAQGATEKRKAAEAMAQARDTAAFNQHVSDMIVNGVKPQSTDWKAGIATGLATYPHVDPRDVSKFGSSLFPGEALSPDEILSKVHGLQQQNPDAQVSINPKGEASVVVKPQALNPAQHRAAIADQMKDDRLRDSEIEKQIANLPDIVKQTTGIFEDNGVKKFGSANVKKEDSPAVSPTTMSAFNRYQALLKEREIISQRHQSLQDRMSKLYTDEGAPAGVAPAAAPTQGQAPIRMKFEGGKLVPVQ
jgi:hypothetical protein